MKKIFIIQFSVISFIAYSQHEYPQTDDTAIEFQDLFSATLREDVACFRIPSIITAPNGDLVAVIDERVPSCGDLKWSKDINIVARRSVDNGHSWMSRPEMELHKKE